MDEFVANEAATHFRADQLESARQIIRRFVIIVLQLVKDLFTKDTQITKPFQRNRTIGESSGWLRILKERKTKSSESPSYIIVLFFFLNWENQ